MRKPGFVMLAASALLVSAAVLPAGAKRTASRVYTTNERDGTLSVLDGGREQLIRTIRLDARARASRCPRMDRGSTWRSATSAPASAKGTASPRSTLRGAA